MIIPTIITAVTMYFFFNSVGLLNTMTGIVIAHTVLALPFVVIIMSATFSNLDVNLLRAAANLGASPFRAFRTVVVPTIVPGLVTSAVFSFVTSFDEVVIVNFIAGPAQHTLTREIWKGTREELRPTILAVAVILVAMSAVVFAIIEVLRRRAERLQARIDRT
jgi:putative spermidine/putrescine transport system permease protein